MKPRFFSNQPITSEIAELHDAEHQHMTKVMRLGVGDEVTLFDGSGFEFSATIEKVSRQAATLSIDARVAVDRELDFELSLGVALPKGDRQQWLVEKLVELGVTRLTPLVTERGVAQPGEKAMKRLQRWIVAASKQSRRNRLMEVTEPKRISEFLKDAASHNAWVVHPGDGTPLGLAMKKETCENSFFAIGPEGGFSDSELEAAWQLGAKHMTLGPRILRIETAAIAVAAGVVFGASHE